MAVKIAAMVSIEKSNWWEDEPHKPPNDGDQQLADDMRAILSGLPDSHPAVVLFNQDWPAEFVSQKIDDPSRVEKAVQAIAEWQTRRMISGAKTHPPIPL